MKPPLLLHICCANCATVPIELLQDQFEVSLFWYNPNVYPQEEYQRRLKDAEKLIEIYRVNLIKGAYDSEQWFDLVKGLEKEPEGGKRCRTCFQMRLEKAAQFAKNQGFNDLATTLTMGPQKRAKAINNIGKGLAEKYNLKFFSTDFKKRNGFKKSIDLSKNHNFYRQNYCGCVYSLTNK